MIYNCEVCGKSFEASPAAKRKYCSRACWRKSITKKVERTCESCGKTFLAKRDKVRDGFGKYCSRDCADTGWEEPCANCGDPVHRTPSHAERFDNAFCNRECYGEWKRDRVDRVCDFCGETYRTKASKNTVYCSQECYDEARKQTFIVLTCQQCGEGYRVPESHVGPSMYQGKYCSNECRSIARRLPDSVRSEYNHEFTPKLKRKIRKRDNYTCQECGKHGPTDKVRLDVHHIDYDKTNNHPSNLVTLCRSCHSRTSNSSNREYWIDRYSS